MEMSIGQVVASIQAINAILRDESGERKLPFRIKHRLVVMKNAFTADFDLYEKHRTELVQQHGDEIELENGEKTIEVRDPEKLKSFYKDIEDVLTTTVQHDFQKLTKEDLIAIEDIDLDITELQIHAFFKYLVEEGA